MPTVGTKRDRYVPKIRIPGEEYSLFDRETGQYSFIEQGFGVCDRLADGLNFKVPQVGEIEECLDSVRRTMKHGAD